VNDPPGGEDDGLVLRLGDDVVDVVFVGRQWLALGDVGDVVAVGILERAVGVEEEPCPGGVGGVVLAAEVGGVGDAAGQVVPSGRGGGVGGGGVEGAGGFIVGESLERGRGDGAAGLVVPGLGLLDDHVVVERGGIEPAVLVVESVLVFAAFAVGVVAEVGGHDAAEGVVEGFLVGA